MRFPLALALTLLLSAWLPVALAQPMGPPGTSPPGSSGPDMGAGTGLSMGGNTSPEVRSRVEQHMMAMQNLRMRMASATTAEQRQSLMNEHLRLMDESMSLMQQMMMGSGGQMPGMPGAPGMPNGPTPSTSPATPGSAAPSGSPGSVR